MKMKPQLRQALWDIHLRVRPGELIGITGKVGSGKSSLLAALLNDMENVSGASSQLASMTYLWSNGWRQVLEWPVASPSVRRRRGSWQGRSERTSSSDNLSVKSAITESSTAVPFSKIWISSRTETTQNSASEASTFRVGTRDGGVLRKHEHRWP